MTTAIDALQQRVNEIRATGDDELAGLTYLLLAQQLRSFAKKKLKRNRATVAQRVGPFDVNRLLSNLVEERALKKNNERPQSEKKKLRAIARSIHAKAIASL